MSVNREPTHHEQVAAVATRFRLPRPNRLPNPITKVATESHNLLFKAIHGNTLIYNACWEDPRIDRQLLQIGPESRVVMLTSAGCNALDYLLDDPAVIHTVDVNPRQNALLQLKLALLRRGNFVDLFTLFGYGVHAEIDTLYAQVRATMPDFAV